MIQLPEIFLQQMKGLLTTDEFSAFCKSYETPTMRGLRFNNLKTVADSNIVDFLQLAYKELPIVPWCPEGRIYPDTERPAKSIFFHAGLFYIQEPSAMCPVEVLFIDAENDSFPGTNPQPEYRVLDLCAAPGGKSAQIAGHLQGEGLLMSNDASPSRSRALVKNLERMGVTNAVVTTEQPKKLADRFPAFFDKILVDAPCSGEGMFRRDPDAIKAYTANKPEACAAIQTEIVRYAAKMLKPGGRLVYSTCTFNTQENEGIISAFLKSNLDFSIVPIQHEKLGISQGLGGLPQTARIFPHLANGEGHFIALLEKLDEQSEAEPNNTNEFCNPATIAAIPKEFAEFCRSHIIENFPTKGQIVPHGANLYLQPEPLDLRGLRVARSGWFLGECAKGRFVPSQALAMGLRKSDVRYATELSEENAQRYLRGESIDADHILQNETSKPWVMVCHKGFPLGWARLVQGRLKNNLPVGWAVS